MTNLGEGNGNPFQYSGLEKPMDGGAQLHPWRRLSLAAVHVVAKSRTWLRDFTSWQTCSWHHTQWWKAKSISSKIRNKTSMSTLAIFIQHRFGSPNHCNQRERNNRNTNRKGEVKLLLFAEDKILYIRNPNDTTRKLLELINEFSKL